MLESALADKNATVFEVVAWLNARIAAMIRAEPERKLARGPYIGAYEDIRDALKDGSWKQRATQRLSEGGSK
jgi:hypothetical protein